MSLSSESGTSVKTIRNYYVYGDDIDNDGLMELPSLVPMEEASSGGRELIRWYNLTPEGNEVEKLYTFHNYADRWYVCIQRDWVDTVSVTRAQMWPASRDMCSLPGGIRSTRCCSPFTRLRGTTGRSWLPQTGVSPWQRPTR